MVVWTAETSQTAGKIRLNHDMFEINGYSWRDRVQQMEEVHFHKDLQQGIGTNQCNTYRQIMKDRPFKQSYSKKQLMKWAFVMLRLLNDDHILKEKEDDNS